MRDVDWLNVAQDFAGVFSGCKKVAVGSIIVDPNGKTISAGANRTIPSCRIVGCLREEKYGDNNKTHRNPDDCRALHSEIDAIASAARRGKKTQNAIIYVTRYPCEACARAIIAAGISVVVFGRKTEPSKMTLDLFQQSGITVIHVQEWDSDDAVN